MPESFFWIRNRIPSARLWFLASHARNADADAKLIVFILLAAIALTTAAARGASTVPVDSSAAEHAPQRYRAERREQAAHEFRLHVVAAQKLNRVVKTQALL
jgi:hypothetical protein